MVGTDNQIGRPQIEDGAQESKMKVLQINTVCGRGSTGSITRDLRSCHKNGGSGKITYGVGSALNASTEDSIMIDTKLEYYVHNALSRFTDGEGGYSFLR